MFVPERFSDITKWLTFRGSGHETTTELDPGGAYELAFANLKTQMWWAFRRAIVEPGSDLRMIRRERLIQDLLSMHYHVRSERMVQCESKDETRKRIGRSPDAADAAVIANWVRQHREVEAAIGPEPEDEEIPMVGFWNPRPMPYAARRRSLWW